MKSKFDDAMSFDPLYEAEKLTGKSYKEDKGTESLGFLMALEHNEKKRDMLKAMNDTYMCIPYPKAIDIILGSLLDFKVVLRKAFMGRSFSKEDKPHEEELNRVHQHDLRELHAILRPPRSQLGGAAEVLGRHIRTHVPLIRGICLLRGTKQAMARDPERTAPSSLEVLQGEPHGRA